MPFESEPAQKLASCSRCGRLLEDGAEMVCECGKASEEAAVGEVPPAFHAYLTWALIGMTTVATVAGLSFTREQFPLGANFGPSVAHGQWWLLVTAVFVHYSFGHWLNNMIWLGFFGHRLERIAGHWSFLAVYLCCGAIAGTVEIFAWPEGRSGGASGAIFGICGSLIVHYGLLLRELSRRQKLKLAALVLFTGLTIWVGRFDPGVGNANHVGGLVTGMAFGFVLSTRLGRVAMMRVAAFAGAGLLVMLAVIAFRQRHPYLVHLDSAANALQHGDSDLAARELHIALQLKPNSPVGKFLGDKLLEKSPPLLSCERVRQMADPCAELQCDGAEHSLVASDGSKLIYTGVIDNAERFSEHGMAKERVTETVFLRVISGFGREVCSSRATGAVIRQANARPASAPSF